MPTDVITASSDAGIDLARTHTKLHVAAGQDLPTPDKPPTSPVKKAAKKAAAKKVVPPKKVPPKNPTAAEGEAQMTDTKTYIGLFAATLRRMIAQSGEVAKQAAPRISKGQYTADAWTKSAIQLMDITALGVVEMAENALAGRGAPSAPLIVKSDPFPVSPAPDATTTRMLSFKTKLARAGTIDYLPDDKVAFLVSKGTDETKYPPGTLPPSADTFRFKVDRADLPGGLYTGEVTVKPVTATRTARRWPSTSSCEPPGGRVSARMKRPGGKVAILGGGMAGLSAAWRLSEPGWRDRFDSITVYQRGWRLGGKGASSRGENGRIEEHGLHIWLGCYENAFALLRECYAELDRTTTTPAPIKPGTRR